MVGGRRGHGKATWLAWLRQFPVQPNSQHMLAHTERVKAWQVTLFTRRHRALGAPEPPAHDRPRGRPVAPAELARFEPRQRCATLVALSIEGMARVTDEIIDLHAYWNDILRLATSINQATVRASLMLKKLGSCPRQNVLAVALRELGRIEPTLFTLDKLQSVELRRRESTPV